MSDSNDHGLMIAVARVDNAAAGALDLNVVAQSLAVVEADSELIVAVHQALLYYERQGETGDDYFGPQFEFENGSYPTHLDHMSPEVVDAWEAVSARVTEPLVRARLHDLCFIRRSGNVGDHARQAIAAYLDLARRYPSSNVEQPRRLRVAMGAVKYISRALDLARATRQDDLATETLSVGLELVNLAFADDDSGPGLIFGLLRIVARDRDCPDEVDALLIQERDKYRGDYHGTMSTINVQLERHGLGVETRKALHREQAEAMLEAADDAPPLNAMFYLRDAAEQAKRFDNEDLYVEAVRRLQELRGTDLGLVTRTTPIPSSREDVDRWRDHLTELEGWGNAITDLVSSAPPSGDLEANRALAQESATETPLQVSLPRTRLGRDGLPVAMTPGGDAESMLVDVEMRRLAMLGPFFAELIRAIIEQWPSVGRGDAIEFFVPKVHVPESVARTIGRALERYREGDFDGIVYTLLPCIERLVRELLVLVGEPVYVPPMFDKNGTYVGLGAMMEPLERRGFDLSWIRFFRIFLLSDGFNFRNDALHGNVDDVRETDGALVLVAVIYLASVQLE